MDDTEIERLRKELADERVFREFYQDLATKRLLQLKGAEHGNEQSCNRANVGGCWLRRAIDCRNKVIGGGGGEDLVLLSSSDTSLPRRLSLLMQACLLLLQEQEREEAEEVELELETIN